MPGARKWLTAASLAAPAALLLFLAFRAGGFFPGTHALVALALVVVLVLRVTVADHPFAGVSPLLIVGGAALAFLAAWELVSGSWSGAQGRAVLEYSRTLVYLLPLVALGTVPRGPDSLAWVVRWLALALFVVLAAGLITRLAPDVWRVEPSAATDRLSYPLTYWNGLGVAGAAGLVLLAHLTTSLREPRAVRVAAAAAVPVVVAAIFFTFSRGGIAAALLGLGVHLAVGRPGGWLTGLVPAAGAAAVVVLAALGADALAGRDFDSAAGIAEGHDLALVVALAAVGAALVRAAALPLDARLARRPSWPVSRLLVVWGAAAAVALVVAVAAGGPGFVERQYDRFVEGNRTEETDQRERLLNPGNNGRLDHWRVAVDRFEADPVKGDGAGTYATAWDRYRTDTLEVLDAHSLYLETLGELGLVGLALLLVALGSVLFAFLRLAWGDGRGPPAALFAAAALWAVHAGIDWDWELPATGAWLFAAAGIAMAAPAGAARRASPGRVPRIVVALGCLALAVTPFQLLRSQSALDGAVEAFRARDCRQSIDLSLASLDALRVRPEPYQLLGYCDVRLGLSELAVQNLERAVDRDPDAWQAWYGLALVQGAAGEDPRPAARRAVELNPRDELAREALEAFDTSRPRAWRRRALELRIPTH